MARVCWANSPACPPYPDGRVRHLRPCVPALYEVTLRERPPSYVGELEGSLAPCSVMVASVQERDDGHKFCGSGGEHCSWRTCSTAWNKSWPEALKREIVASLVPCTSVSMVARQYDVNTNLVFTWRSRYFEMANAEAPQLVWVMVTPDPPAVVPPAPPVDLIEIELPHGYRARIGSNIKGAALRAVLDALERQ